MVLLLTISLVDLPIWIFSCLKLIHHLSSDFNKLTWFKHLISSPLFSHLGYFWGSICTRASGVHRSGWDTRFGSPLPWVHTHTHTAPAYFHSLGYTVGVQSVNYCEKHFMWIEGWTEMEKASTQAGLCWGWERGRQIAKLSAQTSGPHHSCCDGRTLSFDIHCPRYLCVTNIKPAVPMSKWGKFIF